MWHWALQCNMDPNENVTDLSGGKCNTLNYVDYEDTTLACAKAHT